jgi:hypothetical protein
MMTGQARISVTIMGLDTHMILETVPVPRSPRRTAYRAINRPSRHYAEALGMKQILSVPSEHLNPIERHHSGSGPDGTHQGVGKSLAIHATAT